MTRPEDDLHSSRRQRMRRAIGNARLRFLSWTVLVAGAWICAGAPALLAAPLAGARAPHARTTRDLADPLLLRGLEWRSIGPYRGGRVTAVTGVVGQPNVYYLGGTGAG